MNGMAAQTAARALKERLAPLAAEYFGVAATDVRFADNLVRCGKRELPLAELTVLAHRKRVSLSATGFYATPKIHYDRKTFTGRPFFYFAYGAAVSEVVIDTLTGENRVLAVDVLHDVGSSLNPALDRGQLEGGFLQGVGWLTMEELWWNERGELGTHSPSTYKIPACRDWPERFDFEWFGEPNREDTIHRSKAIGEPPLMLALSVFHALREAVASVADYRLSPKLDAPCTNEAILFAVQDLAGRATADAAKSPAAALSP
jgi:xanthine dehydrogenase large subunit